MSFHHEGSGDQIQATGAGDKHLYQLSRLSGPHLKTSHTSAEPGSAKETLEDRRRGRELFCTQLYFRTRKDREDLANT